MDSSSKIAAALPPPMPLMPIALSLLSAALTLLLSGQARLSAQDGDPAGPPAWTIYITNDNCPDYTWGLTEEATRQSFADIVRAHLDEMTRTDGEPDEARDRYNMAVTQEALCFIQRYPDRKDELFRRIREGRVYVSPFLCNSLWAFQGVEGAIRTLYPARRLERELGLRIDVAHHIEEPSLPRGMASILSGCGIRWLNIPFLGYDSTFGALQIPPLFILEGPDGSRLRVILDSWASGKAGYTQGAHILREPKATLGEWIPHYEKLGEAYPLRSILASGTHGDISPGSGGQARGFAEAIRKHDGAPGSRARLVNAILPQFTRAADEAQEKKPFLATIEGCFGHSWDLWPVSLAKYAAAMREGERSFLAAEALLSVAAWQKPEIVASTRRQRERAEWCLAMLSDHAWNGTDAANQRHNAELRRAWSRELGELGGSLLDAAWAELGLGPGEGRTVLFNPLSFPRKDVVRAEIPAGRAPPNAPHQIVEEGGKRQVYFLSPEVPGFGFKEVDPGPGETLGSHASAGSLELEGRWYRLRVDPETGGIASLLHKPTGAELVPAGSRRTLCQTVYFDGKEHSIEGVESRAETQGPVLARLRVTGSTAGIHVTQIVSLYADLDRVDFDLRIEKPTTTVENRLCQVFPILPPGAVLRIETTGAVLRPRPRPEGDLLPGADTRRFAVQGFVDASLPGGHGVTIAPLDAFALRLDLDPISFEALGNDQNHKEVTRDQGGVTEFRVRYALRAHDGGFSAPQAFAWSRAAAVPLLGRPGRLPRGIRAPVFALDARRLFATCLKPADGAEGFVLRLWETAGRAEPVEIGLEGCSRVLRADLLERDLEEIPAPGGKASLRIPPMGFSALRIIP